MSDCADKKVVHAFAVLKSRLETGPFVEVDSSVGCSKSRHESEARRSWRIPINETSRAWGTYL